MSEIIEEVESVCQKGDYVCDIFAGTLSVSANLKKEGFRLISNDINSFSYVFGRSYLINNKIPTINFAKLGVDKKKFIKAAGDYVDSLDSEISGFSFLKERIQKKKFIDFYTILLYLNSLNVEDIGRSYRYTYFFNVYTEEGEDSYFRSSRGTEGKRRFFSPANGRRLDLVINKIREWYQEEKLGSDLYYLLISILLVSLEKISNTQGTFHDFIREDYDSRALNKLVLLPPKFDLILSDIKGHIVGKEKDSLEFIKDVPKHKVLYIDPPYNFRQYTSYYFMLNLISDYCKISDLESYFREIKYVRGQNMQKDFSSTFCKSALFISSLHSLISNAKTEWILMSYYDGRNHRSTPQESESILEEIEKFFKSDLFEQDSLRIRHVQRTNYQSYGGHNAKKVNEILYKVKKKDNGLA